MNKDKIIKDLKERNDKLALQSRQHEMREHHYLYKCEQLEEENKKLKDANKKLVEDNCEILQQRINKAIEYIEEHSLNFNGESEQDLYIEEVKDLYKLLKGKENESN